MRYNIRFLSAQIAKRLATITFGLLASGGFLSAQQTVYRPTAYYTVNGCSGYQSPQLAFDGDPNTEASASLYVPPGNRFACDGEVWDGFPAIQGTPKSVTLTLIWDGACQLGGCGSEALFPDDGKPQFAPPTKTTQNFSLPLNVDLTTFYVEGYVFCNSSLHQGCEAFQGMFEIYVTTSY